MTTENELVLTEAEQRIDAILRERRTRGRKEYGKGLTHTDSYDWNLMAMEEFADAAQYLAAQNLRLLDQIATMRKDRAALASHAERLRRSARALRESLPDLSEKARATLEAIEAEGEALRWMK